MNPTEFISLIEETLEVRPGTVSLDDILDEIEWDSLANITFIAEVDDKLGVTLDAQRLASCVTTRDLLVLVDQSSGAR